MCFGSTGTSIDLVLRVETRSFVRISKMFEIDLTLNLSPILLLSLTNLCSFQYAHGSGGLWTRD